MLGSPYLLFTFFVALIKPQDLFRHRFAQIFSCNEKVPTGILNVSLSWRLLDEATCYFNLEKQGLAIEEYRIKTAIIRHSNFLRGVSCLVPVVASWCQCIKETHTSRISGFLGWHGGLRIQWRFHPSIALAMRHCPILEHLSECHDWYDTWMKIVTCASFKFIALTALQSRDHSSPWHVWGRSYGLHISRKATQMLTTANNFRSEVTWLILAALSSQRTIHGIWYYIVCVQSLGVK